MNEKPNENQEFTAQSQQAPSEPIETPFPANDAIDINLKNEIESLQNENADLRDKLLRSIAELENFRRRAEREKADVVKYAVSEFARDAITIGDNLRRAIEAVQKEPLDLNTPLKTLLEGVEVTERELLKVFERHGITRFDPLGEKFDPHIHEAMIKVDVPNVQADIIVQVLLAGYKINDRVLRPAAVIVAKGGTFVQQPDQIKETAPQPSQDADAQNNTELKPFHEQDPDVRREKSGAAINEDPRPAFKAQVAREKRSSTVTKPITESNAQTKKDDLISSFGKRLENGT